MEIKDVIHLYLDADIQWQPGGEIGTLTTFVLHKSQWSSINNFKLILRPLSDMTEEEAARLGMMLYTGVIIGNPYKENDLWRVPYGITLENFWQIDGKVFNQHQTVYLLSKYFDLFNLHEQGLCHYKSDLK